MSLSFKQFLEAVAAGTDFGIGQGQSLTKKKMVWKSTVAAGKQPSTVLGTVGISIGQTQSTGLTSRVNEATLQGLVKKNMKPSGSLEKVLKGDAAEGARLLGASKADVAYVFKGTDPAALAAKKAIIGSARRGDDDTTMRMTKLAGARKLLIIGDTIVTSKEHYDDLVEAVGFRDGHRELHRRKEISTEPGNDEPQSTLRVSEVLRKVRASTLSQDDEDNLKAAIAGKKPTDVITLRDLDQLAVLANIDPEELASVLGMGQKRNE